MAGATLTYCTNVHPGATLAEVRASIDRFVVPLRRELLRRGIAAARADGGRFPVGLWFSAATATELSAADERRRFADFLAARELSVATLNCFPYGAFHADAVKLAVYRPTWSEAGRVDYTLAAARALAALLPEGATAAISTLPLASKAFGDVVRARQAGAANLARVATELARLRVATGREIVVSVEPEPFATLETTAEAVAFFADELFGAAGRAAFVAAGGDRVHAEAELRRHVGLCFDCCHQAVEFEEPGAALAALGAAGIRIGKMQLSNALRVVAPAEPERRAALARFVEPRWLHQTFARRRDGSLACWLDLPDFLGDAAAVAAADEVRTHFHVPIDRAAMGEGDCLGTTQPFLAAAAAAAVRSQLTQTFEIETYTFPVLPETRTAAATAASAQGDAALVAALADEFAWAEGQVRTGV